MINKNFIKSIEILIKHLKTSIMSEKEIKSENVNESKSIYPIDKVTFKVITGDYDQVEGELNKLTNGNSVSVLGVMHNPSKEVVLDRMIVLVDVVPIKEMKEYKSNPDGSVTKKENDK